MGQINTVRGPVDAGALGSTLMHEHVFVRSPEVASNWPTGWDPLARVAQAVERLQELHEAGIGTIVDLTVVGLGRDIELVQKVAAEVDLHIVVATGLYTYNDLPHFFDYRTGNFRPSGVDVLDEYFLYDIENGIAGSGVRPGILKCATDEQGLTPGVERVLRAVARVHRQTGLPISTHTHAHSKRGLDQQRVFTEEGVDLSRVVIGHSGDSTDLAYLEELLRAGSTLGMDRFGVDVYCPTETRIDTIASLCAGGWTDKLVLSHDAGCHMDWFDDDFLAQAQPNWNFMHISRDVLPMMRSRGFTDDQIDAMMVDAPRRILDHGPGY
ncbi:MAG TPA: phosphotriesterase-related protein [Acidimicrobiales bacterium]|nr:phosphotriesterase-related protein [Acidimicrobiales bacterium]